MSSDAEQDLTTHAARRRRVLTGVLAAAAVGIPGVGFAAGGDGSSGSSGTAAQPDTGDTPALTIQDETPAPDRRDCPEEEGGGNGSGDSGSDDSGASSGDAGQTAL